MLIYNHSSLTQCALFPQDEVLFHLKSQFQVKFRGHEHGLDNQGMVLLLISAREISGGLTP